MKYIIAFALLIATPALAQNRPGIQPQGTITPGNCAKWGTPQGSNQFLADAGAPCAPQGTLAIGAPVAGAVKGSCLVVDINGNLAQANCLIAQ